MIRVMVRAMIRRMIKDSGSDSGSELFDNSILQATGILQTDTILGLP